VPFLLGAVVVLVGVALLTTVHGALEAADAAEAQPGPSHERADAEAAVAEIPGLPEEPRSRRPHCATAREPRSPTRGARDTQGS
jgi:hypothetical protein